MKKFKKLFSMVLLLALLFSNFMIFDVSYALDVDVNEMVDKLTFEKIGIGGGGALFEPTISPFDSKEMLVVPDMGGIYITHDQGGYWNRINLHGTIYSATYDPNREGVIYAGGSGLYRSTDNGENFELIFPKEEDIKTKRLHNGNSLQYFFTYSNIYDRNVPIRNILVDPEDSNHIYALGYYSKKGIVYESIDNGENFNVLFTYTTTRSATLQFDFNELVYKRETKEIFVMNKDGIIGYDYSTNSKYTIYESEFSLVDVSTVYESGKTYFIILEKVEDNDLTDTIIYYTNDFVNKVDLTDKIVNDLDMDIQNNYHNSSITDIGTGYFVRKGNKIEYKFNFAYVSATSLNNIYLSNWSYAKDTSLYSYTIDGIIHYKNGDTKYLYGNPFYDHNHLSSRAWNDGCTYALGVYASPLNEDEYIFTTLNGIYYAPDNNHLYPKWTTVTEGVYPNAKYVTNGLDEQRTYAVYEDPFNKGHLLLLNTDLGLIRSEDNGASWVRSNNGVSKWENTIYDAHYDRRQEGVVYGLWSNRHNAPLNGGNETDGRYGVFAISRDGGASWDPTYSSGLPENAIPVKMTVLYPEDSEELTIYLATFNCGFYVSYDSGKTFIEMNTGIERIEYKTDSKYHYIYAQDIEVVDGRIFGLTARNDISKADNPGKLYEYIDGEWINIPLPSNSIDPVDVIYHKGTLYISLFAKSVWDGKNGASWNPYGGGVLAYKDGTLTQIFDEGIFVTSVVFDSHDTMYVSDIEGNIYRKEKDKDYELIYEDYHYRSESLQITDDDDCLYLSTHGGGMLRVTGLNSLYEEETDEPEDPEEPDPVVPDPVTPDPVTPVTPTEPDPVVPTPDPVTPDIPSNPVVPPVPVLPTPELPDVGLPGASLDVPGDVGGGTGNGITNPNTKADSNIMIILIDILVVLGAFILLIKKIEKKLN